MKAKGQPKIKAYMVSQIDSFNSIVAYAESANKAKSLALLSDQFEDVEYIDLQAYRLPEGDLEIDKVRLLDFYDPQDRVLLVKKYGFHCEYVEVDECEKCSAKEYCTFYQEQIEEWESWEEYDSE